MISIMSPAISSLFDEGRSLSVGSNGLVFHAGDAVRSMHLVVEGQIDLVRHSRSGARAVLHRAREGEVLAEASAYSDKYHCDGIAAVASRLRSIPVARFRDRVEGDAALSRKWAAGLAHALQGCRLNSEIRTLRTVAERLDAWLVSEGSLPPRGQWQNLAHLLGVSREALYRELAKRDR